MLLGSASRPWLQQCPRLSLTGSCSSVANVLLVMMVVPPPPLPTSPPQSVFVVDGVNTTTSLGAKVRLVVASDH